jgi:hypothetical protein
VGDVARMGRVGKTDGKGPLGECRRRWEYNIKIGRERIGWEGEGWIQVAPDRDVWRVV